MAQQAQGRNRAGLSSLPVALLSAASFGTSGALGKSLLDIGWTPSALVLVRIGGSALVLLVPTVLLLRAGGWPRSRSWWQLLAYGLVAVAAAQFCYFNAVQYLSVAVALLCEYFAPVLLIGYRWARSRRRPPYLVLLGAVVAMAGILLVLDVTGSVRVDPRGLLWGAGAALSLSGYFLLAEHQSEDLHPVVMTGVGTAVGALVLGVAGALGVLPMRARLGQATLAGHQLTWLVPIVGIVLVSTVLAYLTGIVAVRALGVRVASFVALAEVLFAVLAAALLVGQDPTATQGLGALAVIAGIALIQREGGDVEPLPSAEPIEAVV